MSQANEVRGQVDEFICLLLWTAYLSDGLSRVGVARLLAAHFAASVFIGSTLSHFRQTMFVRPVRSVIAIKRRLQSGHRLKSIETSKPAPAIGTGSVFFG